MIVASRILGSTSVALLTDTVLNYLVENLVRAALLSASMIVSDRHYRLGPPCFPLHYLLLHPSMTPHFLLSLLLLLILPYS